MAPHIANRRPQRSSALQGPRKSDRTFRDPAPGQYLITGSALWLSMRAIGESLAGRVVLLEMWPLRASEWRRKKPWDWNILHS
jgi:hypothetical protein